MINTCVVGMENKGETSSAVVDWQRKYAEDMEKKEEELKNYRYRVLGVSELAKQLEEKKEQSEVMKQKISRLEIALVRVENRASSLEKKLNSKPTADGGKAAATAHIPGPSKQILDTLLAENNRLKTALNNLTNKGHSGYVTAVKIDQLEDVIERQRQQITELKAQITSFTSNASSDDGAPTGSDIKTLQLQVQKLTKSVKMKDEFCSILSSELKKVQEQLQVAKETLKQQGDQLDGTSAESGFVSGSSSEHSAVQETSPEAQDWQRKCEMLQQQFEEQRQVYRSKEQRLIKLVSDKQELVTRESQGKKEALENCANLTQKLDELSRQLSTSGNYDTVVKERTKLQRQLETQQQEMETLHTEKAQLLTENKKLQDSLTDYKSAIGGGAEQPHLQHQLAQLQRELEAVKLEAESVRVERDELKDQNDEYMDNITFLQDRLKQGEADKRTLEARVKNLDLNVRDLNGQLMRMGMRGVGVPTHPQTTRENLMVRHSPFMQHEVMVKDGGHRDPTNHPDHPSHCGTNSVDNVRRTVGLARAPPSATRVMPGYYGGQQPSPSHWGHPSYFPANHNPAAGGMYSTNPTHHPGQQYMQPQRYRNYPGEQYPPDQPN